MATGIYVGIALLSAAYTAYATHEAKKKAKSAMRAMKNAGSSEPQKTMFKNAVAPQQVIMGHAALSGPMIFAAESGDPNDEGNGEVLDIVVHIAGHVCEDVTHCWLDDELLSNQGDLDYSDILKFIENGRGDQLLARQDNLEHPGILKFVNKNGLGEVYIYLGNHTSTPTLTNVPDWTPDMIGYGQCFAHVHLTSDSSKWPSGVPNPKFAVKGLQVYDPRIKTKRWTDNPALLVRWYRNETKQGVADEDTYIAAANLCDEMVTTPKGQERRYRCNYAFNADKKPRSVLQMLRNTCDGESLRIGGRHAFYAGGYLGPGSVVLTDDDIVGDITTHPDVRHRDRINTVSATYIDPDDDWNKLDMPVVSHAGYVASDGFAVVDDMDLKAVPSPYQAQRLAMINILTTRDTMTIAFSCNLTGVQLLPGTTFRLNLSENNWDDIVFKVSKWKSSNNGVISLEAVQTKPSHYTYDDDTAVVPQRPGLPHLIDRMVVEMVTNLSYHTLQDSNTLQAIITWDHRSYGDIEYELNFYKDHSFLRKVNTRDKQYRLQDGFEAGNYRVEVVAINAMNARSPVSTLVFNAKAPETPSDIKVTASNWNLTLEPVSSGGINFDTTYDFAYGFIDNATDAAIQNHIVGRAKVLNISNLKADTTYNIAVREVSRWGLSDWLVKVAKTTFESSDIIELMSGRIDENMLNESLKGALSQQEVRAINTANMLADKSRLTNDLRNAFQAFNEHLNASKTDVAFSYAKRSISEHAAKLQSIAEEILQLYASVKDVTSSAQEYTRAAVGYCVDKDGNITDSDNAVACVAAGNTWHDGPLAEFIRNLQIKTASGAQASIGALMQTYESDNGQLRARGSLTSNIDGQITGIVSNNDGQKTQLDFIAEHTRIGVLDAQGKFNPLFYLNSQTGKLDINAELILTDGHRISGIDDIRAQDGKDGDPGKDGADGTDGKDGDPGKDGADGTDGKDGDPGKDGADGTDGKNGDPGKDGVDGTDGKDGAGQYAIELRDGIFPSDALASGDFLTHIGRNPVRFDVLTYYSADHKKLSSKSFDGSSWVTPQMLINGNLIALGSIHGNTLVAGAEISSPVISGGTITGARGEFGKGGSHNGYHTVITEAGDLFTDNIHAKGHIEATSGNMNNVVIEDNCEIKGRLEAQQIVGDVYKSHFFYNKSRVQLRVNRGASPSVSLGTLDFGTTKWNRDIVIPSGIHLNNGGGAGPGAFLDIYLNTRILHTVKVGDTALYDSGHVYSLGALVTIPMNEHGLIEMRLRGYLDAHSVEVFGYVYFEAQSITFGCYKI